MRQTDDNTVLSDTYFKIENELKIKLEKLRKQNNRACFYPARSARWSASPYFTDNHNDTKSDSTPIIK